MKKKTFACVEMKRRGARNAAEEIAGTGRLSVRVKRVIQEKTGLEIEL